MTLLPGRVKLFYTDETVTKVSLSDFTVPFDNSYWLAPSDMPEIFLLFLENFYIQFLCMCKNCASNGCFCILSSSLYSICVEEFSEFVFTTVGLLHTFCLLHCTYFVFVLCVVTVAP